jgi:hypothetical protein
MHRADSIDEFQRFESHSVGIIYVCSEPIGRYPFDVVPEQIEAGIVSFIPAVVMVPQPIQELVEPL